MGKIGFCSEVSSLKFPFYNQEKERCICHYDLCPLALSAPAEGGIFLMAFIALAKVFLMEAGGGFENLRRVYAGTRRNNQICS